MYGLNEIVAMNTFQANCHKERVSSDHLSDHNRFVQLWFFKRFEERTNINRPRGMGITTTEGT